MNIKSKIKRKVIKNYWETPSPGLKHSNKEVGSKEFNDDIEYERYNDFFFFLYLRKEAKIMFKNYENVSFSVHRIDNNFKINNKWYSIFKLIFPKTMYRYIENKTGWNLIIKGYKNI